MQERKLHLVAYDVADARRLDAVMQCVRAYATGGQKSVYECFLTPAERGRLLADLALLIEENEDRLLLLRLDPRPRVVTLGVAVAPADPPYYLVVG